MCGLWDKELYGRGMPVDLQDMDKTTWGPNEGNLLGKKAVAKYFKLDGGDSYGGVRRNFIGGSHLWLLWQGKNTTGSGRGGVSKVGMLRRGLSKWEIFNGEAKVGIGFHRRYLWRGDVKRGYIPKEDNIKKGDTKSKRRDPWGGGQGEHGGATGKGGCQKGESQGWHAGGT